MNKFVYAFVLCCMSLNYVAAQVSMEHEETPEGSVSVQPMENEFGLKAGQAKEIKITINNKSSRKMQFNVYVNDWNRDTFGEHHYTDPGTEPNSCARWVTVDKKFVEVDTDKKEFIVVKMNVPDSLSAVQEMKWAMLFVESIEESIAPENHTTVRAEVVPKMRWGVHLYQTPPNLNEKAFKLLSFKAIPDSANKFRITSQNLAKIQARCKAYIEISALSDGKKTTLPAIEVPMFPGQIRYFDFKLPNNLAKGKYTLVGVIDGGADMDLEAAQLAINIE